MDTNPYPGAVKLIQTKRQRKAEKKAKKLAKEQAKKDKKAKRIVRGKILCTCGQLAKRFTSIPRYHDNDCIINTKLKEIENAI